MAIKNSILLIYDLRSSIVKSVFDCRLSGVLNECVILQIVSMGFDPEMARRALYQSRADIEKALEIIMQSGGNLPPLPELPSTSSGSSDSSGSTPGTSSGSSSSG